MDSLPIHGLGLLNHQSGEPDPAARQSRGGTRSRMEDGVNSTDYQAVVKAYTNKKGELSYELLNKTLIKAARSNPYVADLVAQKV
ncbi:MAG: hypothetical protein ACK531_12570, partial [Cyanobacteriota bacterium]